MEEPRLETRITRLETEQRYHYEDLKALKEENKLQIKILADLQTSVELLRNRISNVDMRHGAETDRLEHLAGRWLDLIFKVLGSLAIIWLGVKYGVGA